jgi:AraC-like DNA-binding protein
MKTIYRTLQDFFKTLGLPLSQDFELTVHRLEGLHGDKPMESPLFRTNYYSFLLISNGKSQYVIDNQKFDLGRFSFYFTNPGHLKSFKIEELLSGYMLTFTETFIKEHLSVDFFQNFPFLLHETTPVMLVNEEIFKELSTIFEQMLYEYESRSPYKKAILTNLLSILLYKTKTLLISHKTTIKPHTRSGELVGEFKNLLNNHFQKLTQGEETKMLSVKELADLMNIHPNYLTNLVKEETGKSASDWIQERVFAEAQSLLSNTNQTISFISLQLGFADTTHFAKFFKKMAGMTPSEYRKKQNL